MHKTILIFLFIAFYSITYSQDCQHYGLTQIDLDANNVKARLLNSGDFWWDGSDAKYIAPIVEPGFAEVSAIFAGALWLAATDPTGTSRVAAQTYRQSSGATDYYPGPLVFGGESPTVNDCEDWDRFWKVNSTEVQAHINDFNDNNIIDNPQTSIFGWPGRNNPSFTSYYNFGLPADQNLAPFFDQNNDGNYDPDLGDYPLIKGDQTIWWVFNDLAGLHRESFGSALGVEVQVMAYAESSSDIDINNATYYDFKITNKSNIELREAFMGLWVDFDLGCAQDDYVGYNEEYQMMYAYNDDDVDGDNGTLCSNGTNTYKEKIPMIGIRQIGNSNFPVTSFTAYDEDNDNYFPLGIHNQYYNYLRGNWENGTPLTFGGEGYNSESTDTVSFLFPGDPSDNTAWSMCSENLPSKDRKCIMSTGMNTLQPGQSFTNTYAVIFVEDIEYPCPSLDRLLEATDVVTNNIFTSTTNLETHFGLQIYPNPAGNVVHVKSERSLHRIQLLSLEGQILKSINMDITNSEYALGLDDVSNGLYFVSVFDMEGNSNVEKIIVQK